MIRFFACFSPYKNFFPSWSYWSAWSDCITPHPFWCIGSHNRTRNCHTNATNIVSWEILHELDEDGQYDLFGKQAVCGTEREFYGWKGLQNGSYDAVVETNCHVNICSKWKF